MSFIIFEDITEKADMERAIIQQNRELSALNQIGHSITQTLEHKKLLRIALDKIVQVMECDGGGIYIRESKESDNLLLKVTNGLTSNFIKKFEIIKLGVGLLGKGLAQNQAVILENINQSTKLTRFLAPEGMKLAVSVPIKVKSELTGAINVASYKFSTFDPWKVQLLLTIGNHLGIVIENSILMETLKKNGKDLQRLSLRIIKSQEYERKRISRELHDEASQALIAAKINLEMIKESLPADLKRKIGETTSLLVNTLENLRRISHNLRPLILDDLGLIPTLRWFTKNFATRTGIAINFKVTRFEKRFGYEMETSIYRIIQEALTNVHKHSKAKKVNISLKQNDSRLIIKVEDDGKGFNSNTLSQATNRYNGWGLLGVKERVIDLKGAFRIESKKNEGTNLLIELPIFKSSRNYANAKNKSNNSR